MILILADSLRYDFAIKYLKGIFPEESWSKFKTIETFTPAVLATIATGKTPEELEIPRDSGAFFAKLDSSKFDSTLFDGYDSWITISRLIGNGPRILPPARRPDFPFMPPIKWNAVSNHDDDILEYVGRKWSMATNDWWDFFFYHSWLTHGPWGVDDYGPKEIPVMQHTDRWMQRMAREGNIEILHKWYKLGIDDFASRLRSLHNITGGYETIIITADHGEALGEEGKVSHYSGEHELEELLTVSIWINRKEKIPDNISHITLKDWVYKMYVKYERDNEEYQEWKQKKIQRINVWGGSYSPEECLSCEQEDEGSNPSRSI